MEYAFAEPLKDTVLQLLLAAAIFFLIEKIRPAHKKIKFFKKDFKKELGLAFINGAIFAPVFTLGMTVIVLAGLKSYLPYQIFDEYLTRLPVIVQMFAGAFIMDLATYARHRFMHRFGWNYHSMHHSAEEITWLTALRLHPVDILAAVIFDTTLLHILGFSGPGIVFAAAFMWFYNYFLHANIDLEYDAPLRYILASPNFHRWHHATDKKAYDKNFCSAFSCIDLMFGTYCHPKGLPEAYGLSPAEQKETPPDLGRHLLHPFKKHFKKKN